MDTRAKHGAVLRHLVAAVLVVALPALAVAGAPSAAGGPAAAPTVTAVTANAAVLGGGFTATNPTRVLDTRTGTGAPAAQLGAGSAMTLTVPNLPAGTSAVVLNLTATNLTGAGGTYISACPAAQSMSTCAQTSVLNPVSGATAANALTLPVAQDGQIHLYNNTGAIDLLADVTGYLTGGFTGSRLDSHVRFGASAAGFTGTGTQVSQLESQLGAPVGIASSFRGPGDLFPTGEEVPDAASGHTLLVAWDMGATAADRFTTYSSGQHDGYLHAAAAFARDSHATIYLRPWAEMNGDWQPFQPTADGAKVAGGTPAEFVAAWQHVVTLFRTDGASNVRFVFNPTADTYLETTPVASIFPGVGYVDVQGLDGYNWGADGPGGWRSFDAIFAEQYWNLTALAPGLPVWICEVGSKEPLESDGGAIDPKHSKSDWYSAALSSTTFPAVRAVSMFDIRKERDWRAASSPPSLQMVTASMRAAAGR